MNHKDRSLVLALLGAPLLLIGTTAALLGPAEMYCFYLFSDGGRFHYQGFGFGSFMFGNIAAQIVGYYLIAIVLISLGYGHLKVRRWARPLSLALLWSWLVVGMPLALVFFFILLATKELSVPAVLVTVVLLAASYFVIPGLLIRFYRSRDVRLTFEAKDPRSGWIERLPVPVLRLAALELFYTVVLHIPILFNGIFPLFGTWALGLQGILLLDASIACLALLTWGVLRQRTWAWWGSLIYFGLMISSAIVTLSTSSYADILSILSFPPTEVAFLDGLPFQGFHFAVLIGIPLLLTLGVIVLARPHFGAGVKVSNSLVDHD